MARSDTAITRQISGSSVPIAEVRHRLQTTFEAGRTRSLDWRRAQLVGLQRMLQDHEARLLDALAADLGRPEAEAFGADIGHCRGEIRHAIDHVAEWMQPDKVRVPLIARPARAHVQHEPLGTVLVIAPWNYPIQLLLEPMVAAIAAGNCVVGKPSELAPACSAAIAELVPQYVDSEAVAIVEGGVQEATALLDLPWDHVFFTGSTRIGKVVMAAAARHLTPVTLELGGKSPAYVAADADLVVAARRIVWGKFLNAGQTCIAPDYVLVDHEVRDVFVARLTEAITGFYGTDARASRDYGRIVNAHHVERLRALLDAPGSGRVAIGGEIDVPARFIAPTVLVEPDVNGALMADEIFGPLLPVIGVAGRDHAIAFVNERPKPLALYVFTSDSGAADDVLARTSSGGACVNHTLMHLLPPELPFGGVGQSGMGAYHGRSGFETFSHAKSVLTKPTSPDPKIAYPPYTRGKLWAIRKVLR
jgi:aldehyde dehydrogenase (NAD+)